MAHTLLSHQRAKPHTDAESNTLFRLLIDILELANYQNYTWLMLIVYNNA